MKGEGGGTHDEVGVEALHVDALVLHFLREGRGEGGEEGFGAGVGREHGRGDACAGEGAHVQDQAAAAVTGSINEQSIG